MEKYVFRPYLPIFKKLFQLEKSRILKNASRPMDIYHVGSTAIEGLGGKGIIDLLLMVDPLDMDPIRNDLENIGYLYKTSFSTNERYFLICDLKDEAQELRRYHIHLTYPSTGIGQDLIDFCDFLNQNQELKQEYANIKVIAAQAADQNGKIYQKIKEPIIFKIKEAISLWKKVSKKSN